MLTFGELFAGIGGFSLGLEQAGMTCKWQVEIDPYATAVLKKHWPEVPKHEDVRTFPPQGNYSVDLICGGFPCQDISFAGKGAGLAGVRSGLWFEFARIIGHLRPRYVIVENVSALLTRGMGEVLGTLASLGYDAEWHVIPASAVGAPHRRDRVWIVAYADGSDGEDIRPKAGSSGEGVPQVSGTRRRSVVPVGCGVGVRTDVADSDGGGLRLCRRSPTASAAGGSEGEGDQRERLRSDAGPGGEGGNVADALVSGLEERQGQPSNARQERSPSERDGWWATEPDVGRVAHGIPSRVDRLRCLGNAVVPQVVEFIGRAIIAHEEKQRTASGMTP
jgi:DNA (cytosine-5)-methyltransferase 1